MVFTFSPAGRRCPEEADEGALHRKMLGPCSQSSYLPVTPLNPRVPRDLLPAGAKVFTPPF